MFSHGILLLYLSLVEVYFKEFFLKTKSSNPTLPTSKNLPISPPLYIERQAKDLSIIIIVKTLWEIELMLIA